MILITFLLFPLLIHNIFANICILMYIYIFYEITILCFYGHYSKLDECNKGCERHSVLFEVGISVYEFENPVRYHVRALQSSTGIIGIVDNREHCYIIVDIGIEGRYICFYGWSQELTVTAI